MLFPPTPLMVNDGTVIVDFTTIIRESVWGISGEDCLNAYHSHNGERRTVSINQIIKYNPEWVNQFVATQTFILTAGCSMYPLLCHRIRTNTIPEKMLTFMWTFPNVDISPQVEGTVLPMRKHTIVTGVISFNKIYCHESGPDYLIGTIVNSTKEYERIKVSIEDLIAHNVDYLRDAF